MAISSKAKKVLVVATASKLIGDEVATAINTNTSDIAVLQEQVQGIIDDGGGGDSLWASTADDTATLDDTYSKAQIISNDDESRDNPSGCIIFQNIGLPNNPMIAIGNPYVAGIGLEAWGIWYKDDLLTDWMIILSGERSGTLATVLDGVRRSAFESFINNGGEKPWMRIEASSQGINFGAGDAKVAIGAAIRSSGTLTCTTLTPHKFSIGRKLWKQGGQVSDFGVDGDTWGPASATMVVASTPSATSFTVTDARSDVVSTVALNFSQETEVTFARGGKDTAEIRLNGTTAFVVTPTQLTYVIGGTDKFKVLTDRIELSDGVNVLNAGATLGLGANNQVSVEVTDAMLHVKEGKTFYNEGTYKSTGWYNGGGQTQTTQEVFKVAGTGARDSSLRPIGGVDWMVVRIKNFSADDLTILPDGDDTIDLQASLTIPGWAAVTLVSSETDWAVWYSPPPPA